MPFSGRLVETVHVPGRLFPVNAPMVRAAPRLFARNERVCALFQTDFGSLGLVLVGAFFVGGIETVWSGLVTPPSIHAIHAWPPVQPVELERGAQMGCFHMGSTVIVLFGPHQVQWAPQVVPGARLRMGESLGRYTLDRILEATGAGRDPGLDRTSA
jgi:phosphatidylserine decarboxylase